MVLTINSLSSSSTLINKNIKFPILKIKYFLVNFAPISGSPTGTQIGAFFMHREVNVFIKQSK